MHLKSLHLRHFRGFSDLTIEDIPASARLIMLIGPNGMGKSSIFDALLAWSGGNGPGLSWDERFYVKQAPMLAAFQPSWNDSIKVELHEPGPRGRSAWMSAVYVRSAYRNEPEFEQAELGRVPDPFQRRFARTTENDRATAKNYQRLVLQAIDDVYGEDRSQGQMTLNEYRDSVVKRVNESLGRTIPHLKLASLGSPTSATGNFYFTKGISEGYLFMNLSGGEKAVFDLIVDLIVVAPLFSDSLICIDEPEAHINPAVQGNLIAELLRLVSPKGQLIVATHAIGMLRTARDINAEAPGTVCFINFEGNFDQPRTLRPALMDRSTWERSLAVAMDDLAALVSPKRIIVCEGGSGARFKDDEADGEIYNSIFSNTEPDTRFVAAGSHSETARALSTLTALSGSILPGVEIKRLIDRDDRHEEDVIAERAKGTLVLTLRNLESYLFSDEVLGLLCTKEGRAEELIHLLEVRKKTIADRGGAVDDFKEAAGAVYTACKSRLRLQSPGNDTKEFMRRTLAPLVDADTQTFKQLRSDIFS